MLLNAGTPEEIDTKEEVDSTSRYLDELAVVCGNWVGSGARGDEEWYGGDGSTEGAIRFGHHLYRWDDRGFHWVDSYSSEAEATEAAEGDFPVGPDEEDGCIESIYDGYNVAFGGKPLGRFDSRDEAEAVIRAEGVRAGYYPNVWSISDHGNEVLIEDFWAETPDPDIRHDEAR